MKQAYVNGIILDGTKDMKPQMGKSILVEDGRITAITDNLKDLQGYEVIDLGGKYITPGLINLHVHLALDGGPAKPPKKKDKPVDYKKLYNTMERFKLVKTIFRKKAESYAKTHLFSGTTTIRTVGGIMDFDTSIRDGVNSGKIVGPRILASNSAVSVPGGHFAGSLGSMTTSASEAEAEVAKIASGNVNLIKLMITGGVMDCEVVGEPGLVKMSDEIIEAATRKAHSLGYKVAAHVESPKGVKLALKYGVDTIEHGAMPDDEMIEAFKKTGSALINTFSPALPYALFDTNISHCTDIAHINGKALLKGEIECAKACLANNIPIGLGNDCSCPFTTHYDFWRELLYFHLYTKMPNSYCLYLATLNNAVIAGIDKETGSIEVGKSADFITMVENPLNDLTALRNISMVVYKGKIYNNPKVTKMPAVEKELDKFLNYDANEAYK